MLDVIRGLLASASSVNDLRVVLNLLKGAKGLIPLVVRGDSPIEQYLRDHTGEAFNVVEELLDLVEKYPDLEQAIVKQIRGTK